MAFERARDLLHRVEKGESIGGILLRQAHDELDAAETGEPVIRPAGTPRHGEVVAAAGEIFCILERLLEDVQRADHRLKLEDVTSNKILDCYGVLKRAGFPFAEKRRRSTVLRAKGA